MKKQSLASLAAVGVLAGSTVTFARDWTLEESEAIEKNLVVLKTSTEKLNKACGTNIQVSYRVESEEEKIPATRSRGFGASWCEEVPRAIAVKCDGSFGGSTPEKDAKIRAAVLKKLKSIECVYKKGISATRMGGGDFAFANGKLTYTFDADSGNGIDETHKWLLKTL